MTTPGIVAHLLPTAAGFRNCLHLKRSHQKQIVSHDLSSLIPMNPREVTISASCNLILPTSQGRRDRSAGH